MALNPAKVAQVARIDEMIAQANEKRALLMEHIRAEAKEGTDIVEYKGAQYVVKATPKEVLDVKAFVKDHGPDFYPEYYKTEPQFSATLVKGEDREGYLIPGTTAISIAKVEKED